MTPRSPITSTRSTSPANSPTRTENGQTDTFTYDLTGQLTDADHATQADESYTYDVFDRRIAKTVDADGEGPQAPETIFTVYNGNNAWAGFDEAGNVVARYLFGAGLFLFIDFLIESSPILPVL